MNERDARKTVGCWLKAVGEMKTSADVRRRLRIRNRRVDSTIELIEMSAFRGLAPGAYSLQPAMLPEAA
jgi:hypothetical protein